MLLTFLDQDVDRLQFAKYPLRWHESLYSYRSWLQVIQPVRPESESAHLSRAMVGSRFPHVFPKSLRSTPLAPSLFFQKDLETLFARGLHSGCTLDDGCLVKGCAHTQKAQCGVSRSRCVLHFKDVNSNTLAELASSPKCAF